MASLIHSPRILSVQSHVVSGYCGNKSATFPLQLLEFEVDFVNTVQLSNHTQYKVVRGQIYRSEDLRELHTGLKLNNFLHLYDHVLSGYIADATYIESMARMIEDIKKERLSKALDCWYTLDPVLGDEDTGYYVPDGANIAESYRRNLLPLADIITPNRFEASILSGIPIDGSSGDAVEQAIRATKVFHELYGIKIVAITSFQVATEKDRLTCLLSCNPAELSNGSAGRDQIDREVWKISVPKLDCPFTGSGDLFAALITAWLRKTDFDFKKSFENTANTVHDILLDTLSWCQLINDGSVHSHELRLIQNKQHILNPKSRFVAERI